MAFKECSRMESRVEFAILAVVPGANMAALCRAFGISRKTGYDARRRYEESGIEGLQERSRRPLSSPNRSSAELEATVVALHDAYPCWGARKLQALLPEGIEKPHPNTIVAILRRNGRQILPQVDATEPARKRFEHEAPNLLWQMDFKGHFALTDQRAGRCHPLTVLDDHSRFSVCLTACSGETGGHVQAALTQAFHKYGLPERITCDNGSPWGTARQDGLTRVEVWLTRLGIKVSHSRPYHPQTQGKDERFHRTLKRELLNRFGFHSIEACQTAFDRWRDQYNLIRPHEALDLKAPITRYAASGRPFPAKLPPVEYDPADEVRKVRGSGQMLFKKREFFIGEGLSGEWVAVRSTPVDGIFTVFFCDREVRDIDLKAGRVK
ncbi:MAG: IS481 family transposase [Massilia sp.]